jgi:cytochrome P450
MSDAPTQPLRYNAFDPETIEDPYPSYNALRDQAPAHWSEDMNSWVLSRYEDVHHALSNPSIYSSAQGIFPSPSGPAMAEVFLPMLIMTDPPRHTALRRAISSAFTRRSVQSLEHAIEDLVRNLIDKLPNNNDEFDFVELFAGPLPALVIADMMGIPRDDLQQFRAWSSDLVQASAKSRKGLEAAAALYEYFAQHIAKRRDHPGDDLISALIHGTDDEPLTHDEVLGTCLLLLVAGHETTTNLLANTMVVLADHEHARTRLRTDPQQLPDAIEELLRYESPVQGLSRTLTTDVHVHERQLRTGDSVLLLFGAANRDHRAFADPDTFTIDRPNVHHLALGRGAHFCLGAPLARLETRIALHHLLPVLGDWTVNHEAATRLTSAPIRGYQRLPIRVSD